MGGKQSVWRPCCERWRTGQHLVPNTSKSVQIRSSIHCTAGSLLGTHVRGRTHSEPRHGQLFLTHRECLGYSKIGYSRLPLTEQDVLGLEVAVNDAFPVSVVEGGGNLPGNLECQLERQLTLAAKTIAQGLAAHIGHRVPQPPRRGPGVENRDDVRVLQAGGHADLALEALRSQSHRQFRMKQLERDRAIVAEISREVHRGHATTSELALDDVAIAECCGQCGVDCGHRVAGWGMAAIWPRGPVNANSRPYNYEKRATLLGDPLTAVPLFLVVGEQQFVVHRVGILHHAAGGVVEEGISYRVRRSARVTLKIERGYPCRVRCSHRGTADGVGCRVARVPCRSNARSWSEPVHAIT